MKTFKNPNFRNRFFLTLITVSLFSFQLLAQKPASLDFTRVDQTLSRMVDNNRIPSLVVGIIKDGELVHTFSKGETKRDNGIAVDGQTRFQIGSLSKSFTSLIIMHLQQDGLIDIDRTVGSYMSDELSKEAVEEMNQIKLSDLLKHTAGLPNTGESVPPTPNGTAMKGGYTKANMIKDLNGIKLDQDRLGKWSYSNLGFSLLGYIAEKASGKAYESLLQKYVLKPFGMSATTSVLEDVRDQMVTPYMVGGTRTRETQPWEMGTSIAAGGIVSTVEDLSKLLIAKIEAYKAYTTSGSLSPLVLVQNTTAINSRMEYGYGFFKSLNNFDSTIVQLGHGGDLDGFASHFEFYPNENMGLVMLTGSGSGWFNDAKSVIESELFGFDLPVEVELEKAVVKKYTGKYDFGKNQVMTVMRRGNRLLTYFRGQDPINLYASAENKFFYLNQNSQLEFELDKKGKLIKAVYIQNGEKFYPKKIK